MDKQRQRNKSHNTRQSNNYSAFFNLCSDEIYKKHMERLIEASIEQDFPLEVNIYGFVDKRQYPSDRFFSLASSMGAKFIIGCDAHKAELLKQPKDFPGFEDFLKRNKIEYGDNLIEGLC